MVFVDAVKGIRRKEDQKKDRKNRIESLNHSDKKENQFKVTNLRNILNLKFSIFKGNVAFIILFVEMYFKIHKN
jgi:hypothetical protein